MERTDFSAWAEVGKVGFAEEFVANSHLSGRVPGVILLREIHQNPAFYLKWRDFSTTIQPSRADSFIRVKVLGLEPACPPLPPLKPSR
jgi:hypothetical protein